MKEKNEKQNKKKEKMMKKMVIISLFLTFMLGISISASAQVQFYVVPTGGTAGNTNGTGGDPVCDYYNSIRYQVVYTVAELTAAGMMTDTTIERLAWNVTEIPGTLQNYYINMGHTTATNSASHNVDATTQVKDPFSYAVASGWNDITFDETFRWNGTDNLIVEICTGPANPYVSPYGGVQAKTGITSGSRQYRDDGSSACAVNTNSQNSTKPYVRFSGTLPEVPFIMADPNTLAFGYVPSGTTSELSYQLSGTNLTGFPGNIVVTAPANFSVSLTSGSGFAGSINVPYSSATLLATTIYVLFSPTGEPADYSGNITNVGGEAKASANVGVTGSSKLQYCSAGATTCDEYIGRVQVGTIDNSSACTSGGYHDYTAISTDMAKTQSYSITITNPAPYTGDQCGIWVDWNLDGDFNDAGETISVSGGPATFTATIIPPIDAVEESTRMRIRITYTGTLSACGTAQYGEVEDYTINVLRAPDTPAPSALTVTNIKTDAADLNWTENGSATKWDIAYGEVGFDPDNEGDLITGTDIKPYTLSGLRDDTTYQWYVRSDTDTKALSAWAGPSTFKTKMLPVSTFPYTENFEVIPPAGWLVSSATAQNWAISSSASGYGIGSNSAIAQFYNYNNSTPFYLLSPELDISGLAAPMIRFDYAYATYSGEVDQMNVLYSTDGGSNYSTLQEMPGGSDGILNTGGTVTAQFVPTALQWNTFTAALPSGTNLLTFEAISAWGNNLYLDNVTIFNQTYVGQNLYFSEISDNKAGEADGTGFIEIFNPNQYAIDLGGLLIERGTNDGGNNFVADGTRFTIPAGKSIAANGFFVISNGSDLVAFNTAWGVSLTTQKFVQGNANLEITNGHAYGLNDGAKAIIEYSPEIPSEERAVQTMPGNWIERTSPELGEPGGFGDDEGPLPVVLATFTAQFVNEDLTIFWATHSEVNNSHWNIWRATTDTYDSAIKLNPEPINGMGTSNELTEYQYVDATEVINQTTYYYWLESVDYAGHSAFYGSISISVDMPDNPEVPQIVILGLHQNYPNPFNPDTKIQFAVETAGKAQLTIYNAKGQRIATVYNGEVEANKYYDATWNGKDKTGKDVASGVYMYRLETTNKTYMKKMLLIK